VPLNDTLTRTRARRAAAAADDDSDASDAIGNEFDADRDAVGDEVLRAFELAPTQVNDVRVCDVCTQ
jgi:hypothetical protein